MLKKLLFVGCFLNMIVSINAQTTLSAGDMAIIGINYDASPYEMSIMNLVPISSGTTIRITDYAYDEATTVFSAVSTTNTAEGSIQWVTTSSITAGTVIKFTINPTSGTPVVSGLPGTVSVTGWTNTSATACPSPASGDNWFIFQGSSATSVTTYIFAWCNPFATSHNSVNQIAGQFLKTGSGANNNGNSYLPPSLTLGTNAIALNYDPSSGGYHGDDNIYTGTKSGTKSALLTSICTISNWNHNETTTYDITPGGTNFSGSNPIFTITSPSTPSVTAASQTSVSCNGNSTGAASVNTPTGGTSPYSYNWTPGNPTGDGTVSVTGLSAGTWTCTVTDANSLTTSITFTITQPAALAVTAAAQTNISCNGGSNGAASINTPTGGTTAYSYNWTPGNPTGDGTTSVTGLTVGTWTCTVTDANGCTAAQTFTITQPAALAVTAAAQTNISCNGGSNGAASINTPTGGTTAYSYNWTPGNPTGDGTTSVTGLTVGTWTCTVTDANGCTAAQTFTITQPAALAVTAAAQTNISCNGGSNGAASINTPTGGTTAYSYNWTPGNPTGDGTTSVTGLTVGTWTCTVTDANGCTAAQTFTITQPAALAVTAAAQTNISCNGGSNGAASINTPTGGTTAYSYNWTPGNPTGDGTTSVTGLTVGTWTCTVTDANGCTAAQTFTITQPTALAVTAASQTNISCNGGSNGAASINTPTGGTTAYSYNWTPGNPTGDGTTSVTGLTVGTWTCTVTDVNGCTAAQTFTITQPAALAVTAASQTNVSCNGGSNGAASINTPTGGTTAYSYNWTPGNPTGDGTVSVTGLTVGTWTCTVTDANGCTAAQTFTITQPSPASLPSVTAHSTAQTICLGNSITLTGSGASTYLWSGGVTNNVAFTPTISATYTLTGTDGSGCTDTDTIAILVDNFSATIFYKDGTTDICYGTAINFFAGKGVGGATSTAILPINFTFSDGVINGTKFTPTSTKTYSLVGTDGYGCSSQDTVTVRVKSLPTVDATASAATVCAGSTLTLTATGAASYLWSNGATGSSINVIPSSTGKYIVTGTAANSCTNSDTVNFTVNTLPNVSLGAAKTICYGANSTIGVTTLTNVAYSWLPVTNLSATNIASVTASPTSNTTYSLVATNTLTGCTNGSSINIVVNQLPTTNAGIDITVCAGNTITLTATGAASYVWSNGATGSSINAIPTSTGKYIVTGMTINNCTKRDTVNVVVNALPNVSLGATKTICYGANSIIGVTTATNVAYSWLPVTNLSASNIASVTASPTSNTTYSLMATNTLTGCTNGSSVNIVVNQLPTTDAGVDITVCAGNTITLTATGAASYLWSNGATASSFNVIPTSTGKYILVGTAVNKCTKLDTVNVVVNTLPNVSLGATKTICYGANSTIGVTTVTNVAYSWLPITNLSATNIASVTASPTSNTTYSLVATNTLTGCTNGSSLNIVVNQLPTTDAGVDITVCAGNTITLTATGAASYLWSNGATGSSINVIPTSTGKYIVTGMAVNNCTKRDTVNVVVNTLPNVSLGAAKTICYGANSIIGVTTLTNVAYSWLPVTNLSATNIASVTASPTSNTTYSLVATNTLTGCTNRSSINIFINQLPTTNAGADITVCAGNTITLTATGAASYLWSNGATASSINVIPTSTGKYILVGTAVNKCTKLDTVNVVVNTLPNVSLGTAKTICYGANSTIGVTTVTNIAYSWLPVTNLSATNIAIVTASPTSNTTYSLVATNTLTGCTNGSSLNIVVNILPIANAGTDVTICSGDTATIGTTSEVGLSYQWAQTSVFNRTASQTKAYPTSTTPYRLTATNTTTQCISRPDTVVVYVNPLPTANAGNDVTIISGAKTVLGSSAVAGNSYVWTSANIGSLNATTVATPTATPTSTNIYTVTVTNNATGCKKSDDVQITVTIAPRVDASVGDATVEKVILNKANNVDDIVLYPNPTSDRVVIKINEAHSDGLMELKTIEGATLKTVHLNGNEKLVELDVSDISAGSYIISILTTEIKRELKIIVLK